MEPTKFENCLEIAIRFQSKIRGKITFTYIGPKDPKLYQTYLKYVMGLPSPSFTDLLANSTISQRNLSFLFGEEVDLDIYIGTHDSTGVFINGTLREYCERYKIDFPF
jgi:hypothetical protein